MPGPKPTPTAILKMRGSWRAKRAGEPQPDVAVPQCRKDLGSAAKKIWKQTVESLIELGVIGKVDWAALERYAIQFVRWRQCEKFIAKHGLSYEVTTREGESTHRRYQEVDEVRVLARLLQDFEDRYGLNAAGRTKVKTAQKETESDPFEDLLNDKAV